MEKHYILLLPVVFTFIGVLAYYLLILKKKKTKKTPLFHVAEENVEIHDNKDVEKNKESENISKKNKFVPLDFDNKTLLFDFTRSLFLNIFEFNSVPKEDREKHFTKIQNISKEVQELLLKISTENSLVRIVSISIYRYTPNNPEDFDDKKVIYLTDNVGDQATIRVVSSQKDREGNVSDVLDFITYSKEMVDNKKIWVCEKINIKNIEKK
jgi:hypothetical protein